MDLAAVRAALGAAPASVPAVLGKTLTTTGYTPNTVNVPHFYPMEATLGYHGPLNTFNGQPVFEIACMLLTAEQANDVGGQQLLDAYLAHPSATSVKAALEADQTLGGICRSVFVHDIDGYRLYTVGVAAYYGARFHVQILGG